MTALDYFN